MARTTINERTLTPKASGLLFGRILRCSKCGRNNVQLRLVETESTRDIMSVLTKEPVRTRSPKTKSKPKSKWVTSMRRLR